MLNIHIVGLRQSLTLDSDDFFDTLANRREMPLRDPTAPTLSSGIFLLPHLARELAGSAFEDDDGKLPGGESKPAPSKEPTPPPSVAPEDLLPSGDFSTDIGDHMVLKDIALKLHRQEFVLIEVEEYTTYLLSLVAENAVVRDYYMDFFLWDKLLLALLRKLCAKLYFKGESQEIDRILRSFSKSWLKQFPQNHFVHAKDSRDQLERIYVAAYLLVLLNTGLHNANLDKQMAKDLFIRDTVQAVVGYAGSTPPEGAVAYSIAQKVNIERELVSYYDSLAQAPLALRTLFGLELHPRFKAGFRQSIFVGRRRNLDASSFDIPETDAALEDEDEDEPVGFAKALQLQTPAPPFARAGSIRSGVTAPESVVTADTRKSALTSYATLVLSRPVTKGGAPGRIPPDEFDSQLELLGAPYLKEGLLRHRAPAERSFFKRLAPKERWDELLVVVSGGELRLYSFNPALVKKQQQRQAKHHAKPRSLGVSLSLRRSFQSNYLESWDDAVGDGNWLKNAALVGKHSLCLAFAFVDDKNEAEWVLNVTSPGAAGSGSFVGAAPSVSARDVPPGVSQLVFAAGTKEIAKEYVDTCNYWGARVLAPPTYEPITLMEYGWLERLVELYPSLSPAQAGSMKIARWTVPSVGVYLSTNDVEQQLRALVEYFSYLDDEWRRHRGLLVVVLRADFKRRFNSKQARQISANWHTKAAHLQYECAKFKTYLVLLSRGTRAKLDMIAESVDEQNAELETKIQGLLKQIGEVEVLLKEADPAGDLGRDEAMKKSKSLLKLRKVFDKKEAPAPIEKDDGYLRRHRGIGRMENIQEE